MAVHLAYVVKQAFRRLGILYVSLLLVCPQMSAAGITPIRVPLPAEGGCVTVDFPNPQSPRWPLPLYLCHYSAEEFNRLQAVSALEGDDLITKVSYQGLANHLLDSRLPSIALAHAQRWYQRVATGVGTDKGVVQVTELVSPYHGCVVQISDDGFTDPCVSARWDKLGRLLAPVFAMPNQPLRQFPFIRQTDEDIMLGRADDMLDWQLHDFRPDLANDEELLITRVGKGLFWGMLEEVKALWPQLQSQAELTENEQAQLFIMAVSKQQTEAVRFLVAQGLDPNAKTAFGDSAVSVATMIDSTSMLQLLSELTKNKASEPQH